MGFQLRHSLLKPLSSSPPETPRYHNAVTIEGFQEGHVLRDPLLKPLGTIML